VTNQLPAASLKMVVVSSISDFKFRTLTASFLVHTLTLLKPLVHRQRGVHLLDRFQLSFRIVDTILHRQSLTAAFPTFLPLSSYLLA
jgi:hypothetical protein